MSSTFTLPRMTTTTTVAKLNIPINSSAFFSSVHDLILRKGIPKMKGRPTRTKTMCNFKTGTMIRGQDVSLLFRDYAFTNPHGNKVSNFKHQVSVKYVSIDGVFKRNHNVKIFSNGSIQATGFMHPGDVCDDIPLIAKCLLEMCPDVFYGSQEEVQAIDVRMVMLNAQTYKVSSNMPESITGPPPDMYRRHLSLDDLMKKLRSGVFGDGVSIRENQELNPGRFVIKFADKKFSLVCTFKGSVMFTCGDGEGATDSLMGAFDFCNTHL